MNTPTIIPIVMPNIIQWILCSVDRASRYNPLWITNLTRNSFSCMFISILYLFQAAMCPSSGELIVPIRHLVYVTVYRWPFGVQVWMRLQTCSPMCPSSGELTVSIRHLVYVALYRWPFGVQVQTCTPNGHLYRVTYTRCRVDTINSPDDGHMAARNM